MWPLPPDRTPDCSRKKAPRTSQAPVAVTRNFLIAGSISSALLYPEFFFKVAPKISNTASKVEERVKQSVIGK